MAGVLLPDDLLVGWTARLGPQGVVQVPVSALLVFLVGQATPGYAGERLVDPLICAGVAVVAVRLTPGTVLDIGDGITIQVTTV